MKKLIIVGLVSVLYGCGYYVSPNTYTQAQKLCKDYAGLYNVAVTTRYVTAICADGQEFEFRKIK